MLAIGFLDLMVGSVLGGAQQLVQVLPLALLELQLGLPEALHDDAGGEWVRCKGEGEGRWREDGVQGVRPVRCFCHPERFAALPRSPRWPHGSPPSRALRQRVCRGKERGFMECGRNGHRRRESAERGDGRAEGRHKGCEGKRR